MIVVEGQDKPVCLLWPDMLSDKVWYRTIPYRTKAPHYERKRRDFHSSDLTVLYFRRRDAGLLAATRRRLGSAVEAMLQRPSHAAAAELRASINTSAPFAAELRAERRAARNLELRVTAAILSAKLRSMSVSS